MAKKISGPASRWMLRCWPLFLLVPLLLAGLSYPPTIELYRKISTDPIDLLAPNHPNVRTLREIRRKFEDRTRVAIVLESDHPEKTRAYLREMAVRLEAHPAVRRVVSRKIGYEFFNRYKLMFLDLEDLRTIRDRIDRRIQKEKLKGLLLDLDDEELEFGDIEKKYRNQYSDATRDEYFVSEDKRIYTVYLESRDPGAELSAASRFSDKLAAFVAAERPREFEPSLQLYFAGPSKVLEYRAMIQDLKRAGIISGIAILLPLLLRFRRLRTVALVFAPLLLGIPISLAVGRLFIDKLSIITSFLFAILGGLGIETGIHLYSHYHASRRAGHPPEAALQGIYGSLGRAILTSVASVAVTFLLLVVNDFRGFSEFGLIAGLGLWILFLLYFIFFPAL